MRLYRLIPQIHKDDPINGQGALLHGGRWNPKGTPVIYTSESRSLALAEYLVNVDMSTMPIVHMVVIEVDEKASIDTPMGEKCGHIQSLDINDCVDLNQNLSQDFGRRWVISKESLLLKVPSVVVQEEWNYLINPSHSEFSKVIVIENKLFNIDSRFSSYLKK